MKNLISSLFLSFLLLNASIVLAKGKKMSVLHNQPLFKLLINTFGSKHIINVNGVSVIKDMDSDGQSESTLPINHLMKSGKNTIDIYILPNKPGELINPLSRAKVSVNVASNKQPETAYLLTDINFEASLLASGKALSKSRKPGKLDSNNNFSYSEDGDVFIHEIEVDKVLDYKGGIKITREIEVNSELPLWKFFESEILPNYDDMNDEDYYKELESLLNEYLKVQNAISTGDIQSVLPLFSERNSELDLAFYQPTGTYDKKIKTSLLEAAEDDGLKLVTLTKNHVNFTVEDNKKLTSLTRNEFKPAISLNFKEGNGSQRYPLIFRLDKNKWVLTR